MSNDLLLEPTATAQWKHLLDDAKQQCHCQLNEEIESYLIFTLMRFTQNPELASKALAPDFLRCADLLTHAKENTLRDVGDQCLLLSGLFPQRAEKRLVTVGYYVGLGQSAYQQLSSTLKEAFAYLYHLLSNNFVQMMDVLQNIRCEPALQPLQAMELWQQTGSDNAYKILTSNRLSTPVSLNTKHKH
jgi:hypothetical protein